jgi:dextranase
MTASAKALVIDLSGQAAGINKVVETKQKTSSYYTLTGSRVDHPTKGIYIYQGKKIIKK